VTNLATDLAFAAGVLAATHDSQTRAGLVTSETADRLAELARGWADTARDSLTDQEADDAYEAGWVAATTGDLY